MKPGVTAARLRDAEKKALEWEERAHVAQQLARRFFALLSVQVQVALVDEAFTPGGMAVVDPAFDAAQRLFARERVHVEPCRRIIATQEQVYTASWPSGETRFLTRDQLVMLGGSEVGPVDGASSLPVWSRA